MMEFKTTTNYILILAAVNIILGLFGVFISYELLNKRMVDIDRLNAQLLMLQSLNTKTNSIGRIASESASRRDQLNLYFITKETTGNFIEELESDAARLGVDFKLNSLDIGKEKTGNKASYLKLDLVVSGNFPNVFRFLRVLETMPYKLRFNAVKIDKGTVAWSGQVTFDLLSYIDK